MSIAEIKQQLHKYIDTASEQDIKKLFSFAEDNNGLRYAYSADELNEFHKRRDEFLSEGAKGFSVKETHDYIRQNKTGS